MKHIKLIFIFLAITILINSCSSLRSAGEILRNEKTKTTDEFLIKKKKPLTQPPDFDVIPAPGSKRSTAEKKQSSIEKMLNKPVSKNKKPRTKSSSIEESILNKIKK